MVYEQSQHNTQPVKQQTHLSSVAFSMSYRPGRAAVAPTGKGCGCCGCCGASRGLLSAAMARAAASAASAR